MSKGLDDEVKRDIRKLKRLKGGPGDISVTRVLEGIMWTFAVLFLVGMLAAMPWVGPNGYITGETWLIASLGGMTLFGGLALLMRQLPEI